MNKTLLWFYLSCKRQLKHPFFIIMLLLLPTGMWLLHEAESQSSDKIAIALYTEENTWNERVASELINGTHSFDFYLCKSKEELSKDVASGTAECGYVFSKELRERLPLGTYKRLITVVTSPSTVTEKLASETVFAGLFRVYGRELLKAYSEEGEPFKAFSGNAWAELEPIYDGYLVNGSTFSFEYVTVDGEVIKKDSVKAVFPIKGIAAIFIFVIGLAAAVTACEDNQRGLFASVGKGRKAVCIMAQLAAPVALTCGVAFLCLLLTGNGGNPGKEISALLFYGVITVLFSYLLMGIVKNPLVLAGFIPFFIIAGLTACPVFADLSAFLPVLRIVRLFLPPYYYLIL